MAYVALFAEGGGAVDALASALEHRRGRISVLTQGPHSCLVRDTNMAREFVRDVKAGMTSGKLTVLRVEDLQEVFEPGGGEPQ